MDPTRFDRLTRALAAAGSRRAFVGTLTALAVGTAGTFRAAAACPPGQGSRRGVCVCRATGRPPVAGACRCPRGQSDTGDGQGCLECRTPTDCPASDACDSYTCEAGRCVQTAAVCDDGQGLCTTKSCDPDTGCTFTPVACPEAAPYCVAATGACVECLSDGHCVGEKTCQSGVCACSPGFAACNDLCYAVVSPPDTPAGAQLVWLLSILNGAPFTVQDVDDHFNENFDDTTMYNFLVDRVAHGSAHPVSATNEVAGGVLGRKTVAYAIRRSAEYDAVPRATLIDLRVGPLGVISYLTMNGTQSDCPPRP